jgi:hypothetical protein
MTEADASTTANDDSAAKLFRELEVRSKHRFAAEASAPDNRVDVEEEPGVSSGEIRQKAFWHGPKVAFYIVRQVLIVMFL